MDEKHLFYGVYTALVTPMQEDGTVDWATLERLVEEQVEAGVQGLVVVGTTGESPTLDTREHLEVIDTVIQLARRRIQVVAGTGSNSTSEALYLTRSADAAGADAFLQVAPYYNKPSQEGLYRHFREIAECTGKPLMLYSIPGRCGIDIAVETVRRLAADCPNIRTIKEAGGDPERVSALLQAVPDLTILCGDDGLIEPFIERGAKGVVSVASNLAPEVIRSLTEACLENPAGAHPQIEEWEALLTELVFLEGNPVTIKEALYQSGRIPYPAVRLPLVRASENTREQIHGHLKAFHLLPA